MNHPEVEVRERECPPGKEALVSGTEEWCRAVGSTAQKSTLAGTARSVWVRRGLSPTNYLQPLRHACEAQAAMRRTCGLE